MQGFRAGFYSKGSEDLENLIWQAALEFQKMTQVNAPNAISEPTHGVQNEGSENLENQIWQAALVFQKKA